MGNLLLWDKRKLNGGYNLFITWVRSGIKELKLKVIFLPKVNTYMYNIYVAILGMNKTEFSSLGRV